MPPLRVQTSKSVSRTSLSCVDTDRLRCLGTPSSGKVTNRPLTPPLPRSEDRMDSLGASGGVELQGPLSSRSTALAARWRCSTLAGVAGMHLYLQVIRCQLAQDSFPFSAPISRQSQQGRITLLFLKAEKERPRALAWPPCQRAAVGGSLPFHGHLVLE